MTRTRIISADADAASAWRVPDMTGAPAVQPARTAERKPAMSVDEIERLQKAAYDEAFAEGRTAGYESGYKEGIEAGRVQGEGEARALVQRMGNLLVSLSEPAAELDDAAERELTELSLIVARQVIRRELQSQPGEIIGVIREAVGLLPMSTRRIRIRLNPQDATFVRETLGETEGRWDLIEDPAVTRGGCFVDTDVSRVDATLEHRIGVMATELLGDGRRTEGEDSE